jgi:leucine dehydrogenase
MLTITEIPVDGFEKVIHGKDEEAGLNAMIAVYSTALGPSLGGIRMLPYPSEEEALTDVTRLAKAMAYKAAVADTGQGGGKAVIIGDPNQKTEAQFIAMGKLIESLDGAYIAAEDMNMTVHDLEIASRETKWVSGLAIDQGSSGNPSPITALGCYIGLKTLAREIFGKEDLSGRSIAVQGVGAVGWEMARMCAQDGADVAVCDLDSKKAQKFADQYDATAFDSPDAVLTYPCDLLSPCARGGILNKDTIPNLNCRGIGGAANNQLQEPEDGRRLKDQDILYAPDYVINAGGVINIACEFSPEGYSVERARQRVQSIDRALREIFQIAKDQNIPTAEAADQLAIAKITACEK